MCTVPPLSHGRTAHAPRSLGGRRNVGCKLTAAVYFSPICCQISRYSATKSSKTIPSLGPIFAQTPSAAQAPSAGPGIGAVIGGVAGAVVGGQIGGGSGRTAATVIGAVGGAVAGNAIEKSRAANASAGESYRVSVQVDNGPMRAYDMSSYGDLRIGDRVRIENGQLYRVM